MLINKFYFTLVTKKLTLRKNVMITRSCKLEGNNFFGINTTLHNSTIGSYTYFGENCKINNLKIGKFCSIGNDVKIGITNHPTSKFVSSSPYFYLKKHNGQKTFVNKNQFVPFALTEIGNDVFIGSNVIIKDGLKIGDGAVIGVGAVVVKDVSSYSIVAGVPAKEINKRFDNKYIKKLIEIKWWNNDLDWIKSNAHKFHDIKTFFE